MTMGPMQAGAHRRLSAIDSFGQIEVESADQWLDVLASAGHDGHGARAITRECSNGSVFDRAVVATDRGFQP